jgi:hypothetical protein
MPNGLGPNWWEGLADRPNMEWLDDYTLSVPAYFARQPESAISSPGVTARDRWGRDIEGFGSHTTTPVVSMPAFTGPVAVPDWAAERYDTPRQFYDELAVNYPEGIPASVAQEESQRNWLLELTRQAQSEAMEQLSGRREELAAAQQAWADDPERAALSAALTRATEEDVFGEREQAAGRLQLAQASAVADALSRTGVGARGQLGGGLATSQQQARAAQTAAHGLQLQAQYDAANQAARRQAIANLGGVMAAEQGVDLQYQQMLNTLDAQIAQTAKDISVPLIDYVGLDELEFSREVYQSEAARAAEELALYEESFEYDLRDVIDQVSDFLTSGGAAVLANVLGA